MFLVPVFGSATSIALLRESLRTAMAGSARLAPRERPSHGALQVGGALLMVCGAFLALTEGRLARTAFARPGPG